MAWFAAIPAALQAFDTAKTGTDNAALLRDQGVAAQRQGYADEASFRRNATLLLGKQAAAAAQAGGGYGGTTANYLKDSHTAVEMDALGIRYKALMRSTGLLAQSGYTQSNANRLAGAQLIEAGGLLYKGLKNPPEDPPPPAGP